MMKTGRLLVPWYMFPPFRKEGIGGLSVVVWELTRELAERGVVVDVLTPSKNGETNETVAGVGVIGSKLGERFMRNRPLTKSEGRFLDEYEAVLSINNYAARTLRSYDRRSGIVTRQIHMIGQDRTLETYMSLKPGLTEFLKMAAVRRKDRGLMHPLTGSRTICVSRYLSNIMRDGNFEDSRNLFTIPNGIHTHLFRPMNVEKKYDLLFVGRFQQAKGLDVLLRALRLIHETRGRTYRVGILGEFTVEQRKFVVSNIPEPVRESVEFLGVVDREDVAETINSGNILIVPSRYESFGLPALEAMACGIPVLASRVGGLPEIIDESVGILLDPDDAQALANAVYASVGDRSLMSRAATNGPVKARQYDWGVVAPNIQRILFD